MKIFTIHLLKKEKEIDEVCFIEEGFSFTAFVFNIAWLFFHRLWLQAIMLFAILVLINELHSIGVFTKLIKILLSSAVCAYIGFAGRDFLRWRLYREGYEFKDVVVANSVDEAEYKYINSLIKEQTIVADD